MVRVLEHAIPIETPRTIANTPRLLLNSGHRFQGDPQINGDAYRGSGVAVGSQAGIRKGRSSRAISQKLRLEGPSCHRPPRRGFRPTLYRFCFGVTSDRR